MPNHCHLFNKNPPVVPLISLPRSVLSSSDRSNNHDRCSSRGGRDGSRGGKGGGRGGRNNGGGRGGGGGGEAPRGSTLFMFVKRDKEPRHQHDMRAFVMAARVHAKTGKLSEVTAVRPCTTAVPKRSIASLYCAILSNYGRCSGSLFVLLSFLQDDIEPAILAHMRAVLCRPGPDAPVQTRYPPMLQALNKYAQRS